MTRAWLVTGTVIAPALLALARLYPSRKGSIRSRRWSTKSTTSSVMRPGSPSSAAIGRRAKGGESASRINEKRGGNAPPRDRKAEAQKNRGEGERNEQNGGDQKGQSKDGGPGEKKSKEGEAQEKGKARAVAAKRHAAIVNKKRPTTKIKLRKRGRVRTAETAEREQTRSSPPPPTSSGSAFSRLLQFLASLFKWVIYGVAAVFAFILARRALATNPECHRPTVG